MLIQLSDGSTVDVRRVHDLPVEAWEYFTKCARCGLTDLADRSKLVYGQMCCSRCVEETRLTVEVARGLKLPYGVVQCSRCGELTDFEALTRLMGQNVCGDCFDALVETMGDDELREEHVDLALDSEFVED